MRRHLLAAALTLSCGLCFADEVPTGPLPHTVVPTLVHLDLQLDPRQADFGGSTRIEATVATRTRVIWMHGKNLTIRKAEAIVGTRRIPLTASNAHLSGVLKLEAAQPIPAGKVVIAIDYRAQWGQLEGAYLVKPAGTPYAMTQFEAIGARQAFPGFDEPSFKQPWEIRISVPKGDTVVANTRETASTTLANGWTQTTFARTEALPSYLVAFAAGPWEIVDGPAIPASAQRPQPTRLRGVAVKGQSARMTYTMRNTPAIVLALEDYFAMPYPFDKLDNLAAPDFAAGAMENAGLIAYRDVLMFADEQSSQRQRQGFVGTSAHELAHQWFGNYVTMRWWDDLWLNEAFATWMGNKIHGQLDPQAHTDRAILQGALYAMRGDSLASTRRVRNPINDFTDIESAFDGITYSKGGAVLNMIEQYMGENAFRQGVRDYLRTHARGNASSNDLISSVAAQTPQPEALAAAFTSFIDQPGVPEVAVTLDCTGAKPALQLRQQRYVPLGSQAQAAQTWQIPLTIRYADGSTVRTQKAIVGGAQSRLELTEATTCPTWVMPNADGNGYYRFTLAPALQTALGAAFAQLSAKEQRVYADSLLAAYDTGRIDSAAVLAALPQFASANTPDTITAGLGHLDFILQHVLRDDTARAALRTRVGALYRPRLQALGMEPRSDEANDDRSLRNSLLSFFLDKLKDDAVHSALATKGRAVLGLGGAAGFDATRVAPELLGLSLQAAVMQDGKTAYDAAERALRSTQDAVQRGALIGALGVTTDSALAARARDLALEKDLLRRNERMGVLSGQMDEEALRPGARQWMLANFDALAPGLSGATRVLGTYASGMCSAEEADALQRVFATKVQNADGGPTALRQTVERIQTCAALRAAHANDRIDTASR